jgi:O-antigen ligase
MLIMAAVNLAIGLLMREIDPNQIWGVPRPVGGDRFSGTLLNSNAAACLFGMLALLCLGQFLTSASGQKKAGFQGSLQKNLLAALTLANFGACVVTGSRTASLLLVIGFGLLIWLPGAERRKSRSLLWACLVATLAMAVLFFAGDIVMQRTASLEYDGQTRLVIWSHYWVVSQQSPWFGFGLGSFSDVNLHFLRNVDEATMFWYINDAHNVFLRILLEGGWPHLLLLLAAFSSIFQLIFTEKRVVLSRPGYRAILVALAFALSCGMVDIALSVPAIATLCAVLIGLLWGRAIRVRTDRADAERAATNLA